MKEKQVKSVINKSIFEAFNKLTSAEDEVRLKGALNLRNLFKNDEDQKGSKIELSYTLKRLVRGCGASSSNSRIGFYTALSGVLNSEEIKSVSVDEILEMLTKELYGSAEDKGKLDTFVGTILICGAVIRSNFMESASGEEIGKIAKFLVGCLKKSPVYSLSFTFLNELVMRASGKKIEKHVMPEIEEVLNVPKEKTNMDILQFLILMQSLHKSSKIGEILEVNWNSNEILNPENYQFLVNLLWNIKNTNSVNHPFYEFLAKELCKQKKLAGFWKQVEKILDTNSKYKEIVTLHFATIILKNTTESSDEVLKIMTPNFLKMLVDHPKNPKKTKEDLKEDLYVEFFETLHQSLEVLKKEDTKFELLKVMSKSPGSILIEKSHPKKFFAQIIASVGEKTLGKCVELLKSIVSGNADFRERLYAANLLQKTFAQKSVSGNLEWQFKHLKFFINFGIFKSNNGFELVKDEDWDKEVAKTLTSNLKNHFYHSLELKLLKLKDEKNLLLKVSEYIDGILSNKYLAVPIKENHLQVWKKMLEEVKNSSTKNKDKKLNLVFHTLILHMGLHLFNNPEVAENAINELENVLKRISSKSKRQAEEEPEWIEVVIDLFLNLLSQNSFVLRNVIRRLYPQLCGEINLTAFHQILEVLDLKSEENPLSSQVDNEEEEDDEDSDEEESDEEDSDSEKTSEIKENGNHKNQDSDDDSSENFEDEEENFEDEEEEDKATDKLRLAVQMALGADKDGDEMDVDDIGEEEGAKLDEALSNAFKLLKQSKKKKKTKADKIAEETLLHFRMRVLDLVDIYIKQNPQMLVCTEIVMFIFQLLPTAIKEAKHEPILKRFNLIIDKLVHTKSFAPDTVKDVTQKNLHEILVNLLDKSGKDNVFPQKMQYLNKSCLFLINCSQTLEKLNLGSSKMVFEVFQQNLEEFLQSRNPILQLSTYQMIFEYQWSKNFELAKVLAENGLKLETRSLRRSQSMILLKIFYKNVRLLTQDLSATKNQLELIESSLEDYIKAVDQVSINEFHELLELLLGVYKFHKDQKVATKIQLKELEKPIQKMRKQHLLKPQIFESYRKICQLLEIKPIKNEKIAAKLEQATPNQIKVNPTKEENGNSQKQGKKRKRNNKEKKLKKMKRLEASSEGFMEDFNFTAADVTED